MGAQAGGRGARVAAVCHRSRRAAHGARRPTLLAGWCRPGAGAIARGRRAWPRPAGPARRPAGAAAAQAPDTIRATIRAWASGDTATLTRLASADLARLPQITAPLLTNRNRQWAIQISQRMQRPGTVLVAVGAAHLAGPDNLPDLLAARGFTVTRLPDRPAN